MTAGQLKKGLRAVTCVFAGPALLALVWHMAFSALILIEPPWHPVSYFIVTFQSLVSGAVLAAGIHGALLWIGRWLCARPTIMSQLIVVTLTAVVFAGVWTGLRAPLEAGPEWWLADLRPVFGVTGLYQHLSAFVAAPAVAGLISAPLFVICARRRKKALAPASSEV